NRRRDHIALLSLLVVLGRDGAVVLGDVVLVLGHEVLVLEVVVHLLAQRLGQVAPGVLLLVRVAAGGRGALLSVVWVCPARGCVPRVHRVVLAVAPLILRLVAALVACRLLLAAVVALVPLVAARLLAGARRLHAAGPAAALVVLRLPALAALVVLVLVVVLVV